MILTLDAKRRLTLPASLVSARPGDNFEAVFDPEEDAVIWHSGCAPSAESNAQQHQLEAFTDAE